jgi:hypothetical protein
MNSKSTFERKRLVKNFFLTQIQKKQKKQKSKQFFFYEILEKREMQKEVHRTVIVINQVKLLL